MTDTRSLQQIKRETEQTRAGLTDTVEQLRTSVAETASDIRQRISPDAIKAEVSDYIKSRGEALMDDVTAAARRNPMQAVAVGASVAYPLLRMARAIPLPVLMVGAGLFFAGSKTGQAASQKAMDMASDLSDEVRRRAHDVGDQVGNRQPRRKRTRPIISIACGTSIGGTDRSARPPIRSMRRPIRRARRSPRALTASRTKRRRSAPRLRIRRATSRTGPSGQ